MNDNNEPEHNAAYYGVCLFVFCLLACVLAIVASLTIKLVHWALFS